MTEAINKISNKENKFTKALEEIKVWINSKKVISNSQEILQKVKEVRNKYGF